MSSKFGLLRMFCSSNFVLSNVKFCSRQASSELLDINNFTKTSAQNYLQNLPEHKKKLLKVLKLEHAMMLSMGAAAPSNMTSLMWAELLVEGSDIRVRRSLLHEWSLKEKYMKEVRQKKKVKALFNSASKKVVQENKIHFFFRSQTLNQLSYGNMAYAMMFETPIVLDFYFMDQINKRGCLKLVDELLLCINMLKHSFNPFHLHLCNFSPGNSVAFRLDNYYDPNWDRLITLTEKCYADIFPKKDIVYLTANSPNKLEKLDCSTIYVIGAIPDGSADIPITYANAVKRNIQTAYLPVFDHITLIHQKLELSIYETMGIMLELKKSGNWKAACEKYISHNKLVYPITKHS